MVTTLFFRDSVAEGPCGTIEIADAGKDGFKNIDELLKDIGAQGPFQWILFATLIMFHLPGDIIYVDSKAIGTLAMIPESYVQAHRVLWLIFRMQYFST